MKESLKWVIKVIQTGQEEYEVSRSPVTRYLDEDGEQRTNGFSLSKHANGMDVVRLSGVHTTDINPNLSRAIDHMVDERPLAKIGPKLRVKAEEVIRLIGEDFKQHLAEDLGDGYGKRIVLSYTLDHPVACSIKSRPRDE